MHSNQKILQCFCLMSQLFFSSPALSGESKEQEIVCPITMENLYDIEKLGMTCVGQVYDYNAISQWLEDYIRDPITNEILPTKFIVVFPKERLPRLSEYRDNMRFSTSMWARDLGIDLGIMLERVREQKKRIEQLDAKEWERYVAMKKIQFLKNKAHCFPHSHEEFDELVDTVKRPARTGHVWDHLDLAAVRKVTNRGMKGQSFCGTNLHEMVFVDCDFARCKFILANISGAKFMNCQFIGDEVWFVGATADEETVFTNCKIEPVGEWRTENDPQKVKEILSSRGLEGDFQVH